MKAERYLNVYSDNKGLYGLFTLDECAKRLKNALRLHICTAEQLEKSNRSAATPSSPEHLPSRSTNSADLLWKERVGGVEGQF